MRCSILTLLTAVALCAAPIACSAEGRTTADPNIPGVQAPAPAPDTSDPRLAQKITYKASAKKLPEVLAEIAARTGVNIHTASESRFWSVRQRKVTLYLKDMPLREFMDQLEKLLNYHFSRSGQPGAYRYTLWQDLNGRSKERASLTAQEEARELHRRRAIDETLRDAQIALSMSPEDAEAIKKSNPWLAYLAGTPRGRAYAELMLAIPRDGFDRLLAGNHVSFSASELSPPAQQALKKIESMVDFKKVGRDHKALAGGGTLTGIQIDGMDSFDTTDPTPAAPFWLRVNALPSGSTDPQVGSFDVDSFMITRSDTSMHDMKVWPGSHNPDELSARQELSEIRRASEPGAKRAKPDPDLDKTARYKGKEAAKGQSQLSFELEQLADLYGLNVMYESYPIRDGGSSTYSGDRHLRIALDDIASQYSLEWTKAGRLVTLRHLNWAERRSWEISTKQIATWQAIIEKKLELDLDTLADMAAKLSDAQIEHNFSPHGDPPSSSIDNPLVVKLFDAAGASTLPRPFVELYGRLDKSERARIWSQQGITFDEIADDPLWQGQNPSFGGVPAYDVSLRLSKGPTSRRIGGTADPEDRTTNLSIKIKVWLRDIPPEIFDRVKDQIPAESLAKADYEPLEIAPQMNPMPIVRAQPKQVKLIVDQLKKEREKPQPATSAH